MVGWLEPAGTGCTPHGTAPDSPHRGPAAPLLSAPRRLHTIEEQKVSQRPGDIMEFYFNLDTFFAILSVIAAVGGGEFVKCLFQF